MITISGKVKESCVDGPGLRYVLFTQGCPHKCPGCHNPKTWRYDGGKLVMWEEIRYDLKDSIIDGVTLSGGEPFEHAGILAVLIRKIKKEFPELDILSYSGYTYEEILADENKKVLLYELDYLIDGRFVLEKKTLELPFRGSSNQRFLQLDKGHIVKEIKP